MEETKGNRIYKAILLVLQVKNTRAVDQIIVSLFSEARYLDNMMVNQEIRKLNPLAVDAIGEVCQNMLREIMPKRATFTFAGGYREDRPGLLDGNFYSATCYWTKDDNILKGTTYRKRT